MGRLKGLSPPNSVKVVKDLNVLNANGGEKCLLALEQFQLLHYWICGFLLLSEENFHAAELLVGDTQDSDLAKLGQMQFYALDVYVGILAAGAVPDVD